jgi:hypothetical protein
VGPNGARGEGDGGWPVERRQPDRLDYPARRAVELV